MVTGTVKWFDSKKGFGFILGTEEGKDIFVHYTAVQADGYRSLNEGETVTFELVQGPKGMKAENVVRAQAV